MMKSFKIKKKIFMTGMAIVLSLFVLAAPLAALALEVNDVEGEFFYQWKGNGKNSLDCSKAGEGDRPDDGTGWIHWVFTSKGDSTDAELTLGGSGSGSYSPGEPLEANVWHFYTPYYDVYELTASITLIGGEKGPGVGLVISDYCPGVEQVVPMLTIEKELLDLESIQVLESAVEFELKISGGVFGAGQAFSFSVDEPKEFGPDDGLAFDVEYLIEEVENEAYQFISISQSSISLTEENNIIKVTIVNQENEVTVVVVNTPKPELVIEKVLLDSEGEEVENSDVEFTVILDGGLFDEQEIVFSVNEPAVLEFSDGLEFDVPYTVTEVAKEGYIFISIDPEEAFILTDEENEVTVTIVNQMVLAPPLPVDPPQIPTPPPAGPPVIIFAPPVPPQVIVVPPTGPQVSPPPQVIVISPTPPQTIPQGGVDEEEAVAFFVSPEDPLSEPEEVLVVQPARPLSTPKTGGIYLSLILVSLALLGSGIIIRKQLIK